MVAANLDTVYNSTATYSCDPGFQLVGVETRICLESAVWSGDPPACECKYTTYSSCMVSMCSDIYPGIWVWDNLIDVTLFL